MKSDSPILAGYELMEDIEITLHAELDHQTFTFEQLMNLRVDGVLALGRPTGENVEVYLGDVLLGSGEILIIESTLAIRVADLRGKPTAKKAEGA
jgi:flagellar motor switch/type III secretory pathway protein FliN